MPGIAGVISLQPAADCGRLVEAMLAAMSHEPFHVSGRFEAPELGVYAGWVALQDSFASHQVFFDTRREIALVFAGECYPASPGSGQVSGDRQSHWLVALYERHGPDFVEKLNGIFSGLLVDRRLGRAFLFNDRYGMERLYWAATSEALLFASEAKSILRVAPQFRELDRDGLCQLLAVGCTVGEQTLFRGVSLAPGGSLWTVAGRKVISRKQYFSPATWEAQEPLAPAEFDQQFTQILRSIVPRYLDSPSPLGIALTAGLDSRAVMACLPELSSKPVCYTFEGQAGETLDTRLAARVAEDFHFAHHPVRIQADFFSGFAAQVDKTIYATDGYFGALGAHEVYLNRAARALAPIRLTGVFGGEVFRSTCTFKPLGLSGDLLDPEMRRAVSEYSRAFAEETAHPVTFAAFKEIPCNIFGSVTACKSQVAFRTPYLDTELVALAYRAPRQRRRSSEPFLNLIHQARPGLARIPTDKGILGDVGRATRAWRRAYSKLTFKLDYFCNDGMPHGLSRFDPIFDRLNGRHGPFGLHKYLRYRRWFRRELAGYLREQLADPAATQSSCWNPAYVRQLAALHINGRRNCLGEINAVLTLAGVQRLLLK